MGKFLDWNDNVAPGKWHCYSPNDGPKEDWVFARVTSTGKELVRGFVIWDNGLGQWSASHGPHIALMDKVYEARAWVECRVAARLAEAEKELADDHEPDMSAEAL
jgi:hypothetical protein